MLCKYKILATLNPYGRINLEQNYEYKKSKELGIMDDHPGYMKDINGENSLRLSGGKAQISGCYSRGLIHGTSLPVSVTRKHICDNIIADCVYFEDCRLLSCDTKESDIQILTIKPTRCTNF